MVGMPLNEVPVVEVDIAAGQQTWTIVARGDMARQVGKITKGSRVRVVGELTQHEWNSGNNLRTRPVIVVRSIRSHSKRKIVDCA